MRIYYTLSFFFILVTFACSAQTQQSATRLPKVVVKGTALLEPNPLASADVTYITTHNLEQQQAVTLADALRRVPGVYVMQNGGIGQETRVSLRGAGGGNTTVIVNGMPLNDSGAFDEAVNLSRWVLDDVDEIQVIRGPMSSLYGPSGMGGVVVIDTKKGQGPHKTVAKAEGGSFHTASQMVGVQGQKGLIDYHIMGSRLQSAGASTTPDRLLSKIQGKPNNPLHQETVTARLGAGSESIHISFFSRYFTRRLGFRQTPMDLYPWRQNFSENFNRLQGHFENATRRWHHDIGFGYYHNDLANTHPTESKVVRNASQAQIDWRQTYDVTTQLQLQLATDYSQEKLYWHKIPALNNTFKTSHSGVGSTLSYRIYENLMITGSGRVDKYQGIPSPITYRLGGLYCFEQVTIKGGIGTAFKAPTLQQKFYKDSYFSGNPTLKPERSFGWDWGIERSFFQNRFTLGITLFQNRIRDLIAGSANHNTVININKSRTQGAEGLFRFCLTPEWTFELSHTYTQSWDERTQRSLIGNPLHKTAVCVVGQVAPEWQISGNILYIGPRDTFDAVSFLRVRTASYTLIGAETAYQLTNQWQAYGRAENLLNHSYENPQSVQQPGIGLYVGIRAQC